jgi:hypothetical protein
VNVGDGCGSGGESKGFVGKVTKSLSGPVAAAEQMPEREHLVISRWQLAQCFRPRVSYGD